jgi:hypothetical protein
MGVVVQFMLSNFEHDAWGGLDCLIMVVVSSCSWKPSRIMFPVFICINSRLVIERAEMGLCAFESGDTWRVAKLESDPVAGNVMAVLLPFA